MKEDNTARILKIILFFGSALIAIGIVAFIERLDLTQELAWKLIFLVLLLPLTVPLVIFCVRFALLYQSEKFTKPQYTVNSRQIKQLNMGVGEVENKSLNINRHQHEPTPGYKDFLGAKKENQEYDAGIIEKIATTFLINSGRYGFLKNDSVVTEAILYNVLTQTGMNIDKKTLLECLTSSDNYTTVEGEVINKAEHAANRRDIQSLQTKYKKETEKEPWNRWKFTQSEVVEI